MKNKEQLLKKVDKALDTVRPHLAVDGGNIELIDITESMDVHVKWLGNCSGCSMTAMTMKAGIETAIKGVLPEINNVVAINE